jgi:hypothetical protein
MRERMWKRKNWWAWRGYSHRIFQKYFECFLFSLPPSAVRQTPHSSEGGLQNKILIGKLANENEFRCLPIPHPLSRELPLHKGAGGRPHGVAPTEKCREWLNGRFATYRGRPRSMTKSTFRHSQGKGYQVIRGSPT